MNHQPLLERLSEADREIDQQMELLRRKKEAINVVRREFSNGTSLQARTMPQVTHRVARPAKQVRRQPTRSPFSMPISRASKNKTRPQVTAQPRNRKGRSTMELVRNVLSEAKTELTFEEIKDRVVKTYRVPVALSLNQMLYKQAHAGNGFYRLPDKKYGLLSWRVDGRAEPDSFVDEEIRPTM